MQTPSSQRRGFTLMELLVASASASVLLVGLSSSLYVASQALRLGESGIVDRGRHTRSASRLIDDLAEALAFSERTATAVTFTVPDRTGDGLPETIRYAWSGTSGEPLTYEYNGAAAVNLIAEVQSLSFTAATRSLPAALVVAEEPAPILLFVVTDDGSPTSQETARAAFFESWGYEVRLLKDTEKQNKYDDALEDVAAVYVSGEADQAEVADKLNAVSCGIVTESLDHAVKLGIVSGGASTSSSSILVDDSTHHITSGFGTGSRSVLTSSQPLHRIDRDFFGRDTMSLASVSSGPSPSLIFVDAGDELATFPVGWSAGRRCLLPWGDNGFNVASLNADGQTLTRQAIAWAAGAGADTPNPGVHYRSFAEKKLGNRGTSLTIDLPPGAVAGDLLIAALSVDEDTGSVLNAPTGWNKIIVRTEDQDEEVTLGVWWKIAGAAEAPNYRFSWPGDEEAYGWIMRFDGHDPASPINAWNVINDDNGSAYSSVTSTVDNALILRIAGVDADDVAVDSPGIDGHAIITMDVSASGAGAASGGAVYQLQETAGPSTSEYFTPTGGEEYVTVTIAIAPAP